MFDNLKTVVSEKKNKAFSLDLSSVYRHLSVGHNPSLRNKRIQRHLSCTLTSQSLSIRRFAA